MTFIKAANEKVYNLHMFVGYAPLSFILSIIFCLGLIYLDKKAVMAGDINVEKVHRLCTKNQFLGLKVCIYLSTILTTCFILNGIQMLLILVLCLPAF